MGIRRSFVEQAAKTTHEPGSPCRFMIWLDWSLAPALSVLIASPGPSFPKPAGRGVLPLPILQDFAPADASKALGCCLSRFGRYGPSHDRSSSELAIGRLVI